MILRIKEVEYDIFGSVKSDKQLTLSEYTKRLISHFCVENRIEYTENNVVWVHSELSKYKYYPEFII